MTKNPMIDDLNALAKSSSDGATILALDASANALLTASHLAGWVALAVDPNQHDGDRTRAVQMAKSLAGVLAGILSRPLPKPRWYGVSFGNGNDGVSQLLPAYYVFTHDPFLLARSAAIHNLSPSIHEWALSAVQVDGEPEHTVSATIYEGPNGETEFGAAWAIVEVFPVDEGDVREEQSVACGTPCYDSIEDAHGAEFMRGLAERSPA